MIVPWDVHLFHASSTGLRVGWVTPMGGNLERVGYKTIASFLNWPESRVSYSLERLNLEKSGMVNRQASFLLSLILRWPFHDAAIGIILIRQTAGGCLFFFVDDRILRMTQ
jgi:hypothetical protein